MRQYLCQFELSQRHFWAAVQCSESLAGVRVGRKDGVSPWPVGPSESAVDASPRTVAGTPPELARTFASFVANLWNQRSMILQERASRMDCSMYS